jgi:hypothetical protein
MAPRETVFLLREKKNRRSKARGKRGEVRKWLMEKRVEGKAVVDECGEMWARSAEKKGRCGGVDESPADASGKCR